MLEFTSFGDSGSTVLIVHSNSATPATASAPRVGYAPKVYRHKPTRNKSPDIRMPIRPKRRKRLQFRYLKTKEQPRIPQVRVWQSPIQKSKRLSSAG
jgi:hypothetical protein